MRRIAPLALASLIALTAVLVPAESQAVTRTVQRTLRLDVLSNRADLISGGDAVIAMTLPPGLPGRNVHVSVGTRDVTRLFTTRVNGQYGGTITGLALGRNVVTATALTRRLVNGDTVITRYAGRTVVTNHPNGGPLFSGPQAGHYICQTGARNSQCDQPATYSYLYKSTDPTASDFKAYDPANPPTDVASTTTDGGVRVPFIVRREDGFQDRDRYSIITLFRPGKSWTRWQPQTQWNHKILIPHGGNCGTSYTPGNPPLDDYSGTVPAIPGYDMSWRTALGRGFAVVSTALDNTGHNCNTSVEAESLVMAKERVVERYGNVRYTIGTGCSGGSIAQQTVANAYPGIYQGLITTCSFPDTLTAGVQYAEFHLMRAYFENPSRWDTGVVWSPTQFAAVEGHALPIDAIAADELLFKQALNPETACPGTTDTVAHDRATRYNTETNPGGVRCSVLDVWSNMTGVTPQAQWSANEKAAGHGFGSIPLGNVGVQYGLQALMDLQITTAQFVDLNAKIGGLDQDSNATAARVAGSTTAIANAYRSGLINEGTNMSNIAMINHGGPDPGAAHDYAHAWWMQDRLRRATGSTANRVMWFGLAPLIGDPGYAVAALTQMDAWLNKVSHDTSTKTLSAKIVADKPVGLTDKCSAIPGIDQVEGPDGPFCRPELQTHYGTPRQVAGDDKYNDRVACQLKPLLRSDYDFLPVPLTDAQWATLQAAFPTGVCDYSKPGIGQGPAQTWLSYGTATSHTYGGVNLPAIPANSGQGWMSAAFRPLWKQ